MSSLPHESPPAIRCSELPRHRLGKNIAGSILAISAVLASADAPHDSQPPKSEITIAGIGDSFMSGHDLSNQTDQCLRGEVNYINLLAEMIGTDRVRNAGCSESSVREIIDGKLGMPSQLDVLDEQVDLTFIIAGANINSLTELINECLASDCDPSSPGEALQTALETMNSEPYRQQLVDLYTAVGDRAPNSAIGVITYPRIIAEEHIWATQSRFDPKLQRTYLLFKDTLNQSIKAAVATSKDRGLNIHLIQPRDELVMSNHWYDPTFFVPGEGVDPRAIGHLTPTGNKELAKVALRSVPKMLTSLDANQPR